VSKEAAKLDTTFAALADGTRRAILERLKSGEASLSDLAEPFNMSQTAVSKHVRILSDAGLLTVEKRGRTRHCRLHASSMQAASVWLTHYEQFWSAQLDNLARHLARKRKEANKK